MAQAVMFRVAIRKRRRKRARKNGLVIIQVRYVVDYIDPISKRRKQLFYATQEEAIRARENLIAQRSQGVRPTRDLSIKDAFDHWVTTKKSVVRTPTLAGYEKVRRYIVGPLVVGTSQERRAFAMGRKSAQSISFREMLGDRLASELMTWEIRRWHQELSELVSPYAARLAKGILHAVLKLAAEDFGIRTPVMPSGLGRIRDKSKKRILSLEEGRLLLLDAARNPVEGTPVAFAFLTGMRPSEQLGLMWDDVDLEQRFIAVRRVREVRGGIVHDTKTAAGFRRVPICDTLYALLEAWSASWGREPGTYVFRCRGGSRHEPGKAMIYSNFLRTYWRPYLESVGVPVVPPHSGRHWFISTLQALGVEVGLVAKIVGHSNPAITLSRYTQAVRSDMQGVVALDKLCERARPVPEDAVAHL